MSTQDKLSEMIDALVAKRLAEMLAEMTNGTPVEAVEPAPRKRNVVPHDGQFQKGPRVLYWLKGKPSQGTINGLQNNLRRVYQYIQKHNGVSEQAITDALKMTSNKSTQSALTSLRAMGIVVSKPIA